MASDDEFAVGTRGNETPTEQSELEACLSDAGSFVVELVNFVAETTKQDPMEMPPLSDAIDPEAVQQVLEADDDGSTKVGFHYAGCGIVVTGSGEMFVLS